MANYKDIHGSNIETVSSDPSNPVNGQVWYNSTELKMKGFTQNPVGSWASGGNLNTGRQHSAGMGTQTAGLAVGGYNGSARVDITETYNGSSWTEVGDLNDARSGLRCSGLGSTTAGIAFGGDAPPGSALNESWNGTTWTEVADLNTARYVGGGAGTSPAALFFGGRVPGGNSDLCEVWNGSGWTEVGDLNTAKRETPGAGTSTSALAFAGYVSAGSALNESWNGTSWTEVADLNTARFGLGGGGVSNASAIAYGGWNSTSSTSEDVTETWNGTAWTEVADCSTARHYVGQGIGTQTSALAIAGSSDTAIMATVEEYTSPLDATISFDAS